VRTAADCCSEGLALLPAISHGLTAIDTGLDRLDRAAGRIARDGASGDLPGNLVDLLRARHEVRTGVAVIRTANETIGTLLDVLA
jgi:hypothetical protein